MHFLKVLGNFPTKSFLWVSRNLNGGSLSLSSFVKRTPKLLTQILKQINDIIHTQNDVQTVAITIQCQKHFE